MSSFVLYPAIDVRGGRVVRLRQGDYAQETRYADDPLAVAERYAQAGARWLHLVDLDAARAGGYTLSPLLSAIKSATSLQVQTGGGVRGEADLQSILEAGADRVVVGSLSVREPARVRGWLRSFGSAHITRRYPDQVGLVDDKLFGQERWYHQMLFPLLQSPREHTALKFGGRVYQDPQENSPSA